MCYSLAINKHVEDTPLGPFDQQFLPPPTSDQKTSGPARPGDPKSLESPDEADIVWRLFIQILFR